MKVKSSAAANLAHAAELVLKARGLGAEVVVLPEMFCCPYDNASFAANAEPRGGRIYSALAEMAAEAGCFLVGGSMPERAGESIFNTSFVFDAEGRCIAKHRKAHLFDIDVEGGQRFCESDTFSAGEAATVFDTPCGRLGVCICFDIRFPLFIRQYCDMGAKALIVPAAFNMTTGPLHWELLFRARAVDNQLFTLGCAPARNRRADYVSYANSIVCDPWGRVRARASAREEILLADIDLDECERVRRQIPVLKN